MLVSDKYMWFNLCRAGLIAQIEENISKFKGARDEIHGATALMHACMDNNIKVVQRLLPHEDQSTDNSGKTGLMIAAEHGYIELVRLLVVTQAKKQRENGQTALMHAAIYDLVSVIDILLPKEGRMTDKCGWTALMYAAWRGSNKAAIALATVEAGIANIHGETAFLCACDAGNYELTRLLYDKEGQSTLQTGETGLHLAARSGIRLIVEMLRDKLAKRQTKTGKTALMYAAYAGNLDVAKLLIDYETGYKDKDGYTAVMRAIQNGHEECVTVLLPHEKDIVDNQGKTVLDIAQMVESNNMFYHVSALLGGIVNTDTGNSTLIEATQHNLPNIVRILVPKQTNLKDNTGMCAIHYAVANHNIECTQILKQYEGVASNADGYHALSMAVRERDIGLVRALLEYCWVPDATGAYALAYCSENPLSNIYQLIFTAMMHTHPQFHTAAVLFCKALYTNFILLVNETYDEESVEFLNNLLSLLSDIFYSPITQGTTVPQLMANVLALLDNFSMSIHESPCCICIDRPAFTIARPCMHMCLCSQCATSLRGRCPYCQAVVTEFLEISLEQ